MPPSLLTGTSDKQKCAISLKQIIASSVLPKAPHNNPRRPGELDHILIAALLAPHCSCTQCMEGKAFRPYCKQKMTNLLNALVAGTSKESAGCMAHRTWMCCIKPATASGKRVWQVLRQLSPSCLHPWVTRNPYITNTITSQVGAGAAPGPGCSPLLNIPLCLLMTSQRKQRCMNIGNHGCPGQ